MGEIESGKMQWVCVCVEGEERKWWEEGGVCSPKMIKGNEEGSVWLCFYLIGYCDFSETYHNILF